jgi:hypothetical protein
MAGKTKKKANKKPVAGIAAKKTGSSASEATTTNKPEPPLHEEAIAQEKVDPATKVNEIAVKEKEPVAVSNSEDVNPENTHNTTPSPSPPSSAIPQPVRPESPCTMQDDARENAYPQSPKKAETLSTTTTRVISPRKASSVSPVKISPPPRQFHPRLDLSHLDDDISDDDDDDDEPDLPKAVSTNRELLAEMSIEPPKEVNTNRELLAEMSIEPPRAKAVSSKRDFLAEILSEQAQDASRKGSAIVSQASYRFASIVPRSVPNGVPVSIKVYEEDQEEASKLMQQLDNLRTFLEETWANIRDSRTSIQDVKKIRTQHDYMMLEEALKLDIEPLDQQQSEQVASTERSIAEEIVSNEESELAELTALQVWIYTCMVCICLLW